MYFYRNTFCVKLGKYINFKMKIICCFLFSMVTLVMADFYNPRYINFNVKPLLENDRILLGFIKCFLDEGPCTQEAKDFKRVIPESLRTTCARCTPKQRELIRLVVRAIQHKYPEAWNQLTYKFDKDRKYKVSFDQFIA